MSDSPLSARSSGWGMPILVAAAALLLTLIQLDPAGDYPELPQGPGLTLDETYHLYEGLRLVQRLEDMTAGRATLKDVFGQVEELGPSSPHGYYTSDHPPLGRLALGIVHEAVYAGYPPKQNTTPMVVACARPASAIVFALTVLVVALVGQRWYGKLAGIAAALSLLLMPRVFGHAHLATLESFISLPYLLVVAHAGSRWGKGGVTATPSWKSAVVTGVLLGIAFATKIQSVLLPIPLTLWALWHWKLRGLLPLVWCGATTAVVFFLLWPWLWLDPVSHVLEYFARMSQRDPLHVWYFGERMADREVPWHYPFVMFAVTVPIGLHLAACFGLGQRRCEFLKSRREQLVLACTVFPLVVFAIPGVAVYDGIRLFLVIFPLWALFAGVGIARAYEQLRARGSQGIAGIVLVLFLAGQAWGNWSLAPCQLSYYNVAVGGLRGADRLGFATTYWGDSLTRDLLNQTAEKVPAGAVIVLVPVLHNAQVDGLMIQSPALRDRQIQLRALNQVNEDELEFVLLFRRQADVYPQVQAVLPQAEILAEVTREGVQLAALYRLNADQRAEVVRQLKASDP